MRIYPAEKNVFCEMQTEVADNSTFQQSLPRPMSHSAILRKSKNR